MDEFGDHITGCKQMLPLRTELWHDPLVQMWHQLTKINPIWHRSQCCGLKWGASLLRVRSVSREKYIHTQLDGVLSRAFVAPGI